LNDYDKLFEKIKLHGEDKMTLTPLHDPKQGTMRIAGLMSGEGTNLVEIIKTELALSRTNQFPFHVAVIFTDNPKSNAEEIGRNYDLPVIINNIELFYHNRGKPVIDLGLRKEYDERTVSLLKTFDISFAAYAGYMKLITQPLIDAFLGVNVHPGDLSVKDEDGKRKYTGNRAVRKAILAGEKYIRSSTHIMEGEEDSGRLLMISSPMEVVLCNDFDRNDKESVKKAEKFNQARLKEVGDWVIFPRTILDISRGRYSKDESGRIHYEGVMVPDGLRLER
jgi:folate-dependent phosphoribosylglycinamide formyltransferase PurN